MKHGVIYIYYYNHSKSIK